MKRNKYLDVLGINIENYSGNFVTERKFQRFFERRRYGFDIARAVKLSDMEHNSDLSRLDIIHDKALKRNKKYQAAIQLLREYRETDEMNNKRLILTEEALDDRSAEFADAIRDAQEIEWYYGVKETPEIYSYI